MKGFGLTETIVGIAVMLIVFLGLFGFLRISVQLSTLGKAKAAASALAQTQMEYLRGFSYDALGTVGGIPPGAIPQTATSTVDGTVYSTRTFIEYRDDPADGVGGADTNGITTDYKLAKVTLSYVFGVGAYDVSLVSNFVPPSIETSTGGGTLSVNVVNAEGAGVPDAAVTIVNAATSPPINVTTYTNTDGAVLLGGAATSSQYQIAISKSGYSSAQTYAATGQNANPTPGYLTVVKDQTTTGTFAIDLLAHLTLASFSPAATSTFSDTFASAANVTAIVDTAVSGGALTLAANKTSGSARSAVFAPAYLAKWGSATSTLAVAADQTARVQVYDNSGVLLPDSAVPGNSSGFTTFPINLNGVSTSTYSGLALGAMLTTATTTAPSVLDWSFDALAGPAPLPNASFTLTGAKTVGSTGGGTPLYKTILSDSTGASSAKTELLEWDAYALSVPGYDLVDACPAPPFALSPNGNVSASFVLDTPTTNMLLVSVEDVSGNPVSGASVQVTRAGFSQTKESSSCGAAYFGNISANTYTVTISKAGYTTTVLPNVSVTGQSFTTVDFP